MISNIQSWLGYRHDERAPEGRMTTVQAGNLIEVRDERDAFMAAFRNPTDAHRYIEDLSKRIAAGRKQYDAMCKARTNDPDEGKVACPLCKKHVAWNGLKQHKQYAHSERKTA